MQNPKYRQFLRLIYGALIQSNLSAAELRSLGQELRRGQLSDELAYMLDQVSSHLQDRYRIDTPAELRDLERLLKHKGISRGILENILVSIDSVQATRSSKASTRQLLTEFLSNSSPNQVDHLRSIIEAYGSEDPYLKGITNKG